MAGQTKTITLTDQWQLAGAATASQFLGQARADANGTSTAYVNFGGATAPGANADYILWPGTLVVAIPGGTSIWVKGTGTFTAVFG